MEGGEGEQHNGEKTSVLKKVKAKAKKLKESIKKHGHLHGHDHDHDHGQHEHPESEEEDEDDDDNEYSEEDHIRLGVDPHQGYGKGFDGKSRLTIPEEGLVAPRNTPISHGEDHHQAVEARETDHQNQSTYIEKASHAASLVACKAIGAKDAVASKLGYGEAGEAMTNSSTTLGAKLQPGEEDKALSELISSTLCKKGSAEAGAVNTDQQKRLLRERVSDAVRKRDTEDDHNDEDRDNKDHRVVKLMGRVTESDEVARRLGTSEEEKRGEVTHVPGDGSPSKPVADMIKAAVSSWWAGGNQSQPTSETP